MLDRIRGVPDRNYLIQPFVLFLLHLTKIERDLALIQIKVYSLMKCLTL